MCRSIKRLRVPEHTSTDAEIRAAALQFIRKVSGFREPSPGNAAAFNLAVDEVANATHRLLDRLPAARARVVPAAALSPEAH